MPIRPWVFGKIDNEFLRIFMKILFEQLDLVKCSSYTTNLLMCENEKILEQSYRKLVKKLNEKQEIVELGPPPNFLHEMYVFDEFYFFVDQNRLKKYPVLRPAIGHEVFHCPQDIEGLKVRYLQECKEFLSQPMERIVCISSILNCLEYDAEKGYLELTKDSTELLTAREFLMGEHIKSLMRGHTERFRGVPIIDKLFALTELSQIAPIFTAYVTNKNPTQYQKQEYKEAYRVYLESIQPTDRKIVLEITSLCLNKPSLLTNPRELTELKLRIIKSGINQSYHTI